MGDDKLEHQQSKCSQFDASDKQINAKKRGNKGSIDQ